jgi:ABC-type multidrug transport system fused ATPase/permease subunit
MENINLNKIVWDSLKENKLLFLSVGILFFGFGLEQLIFPKWCGDFVDSMDLKSIGSLSVVYILILMSPYVIAQLCGFISNTMNAYILPKIEFSVVDKLTSQILNLLGHQNQNVNYYMLMNNISKVFEFKNIFHHMISFFLPAVLVTIGIIVYFFMIDTTTGIAAIIIFSIIFYLFFKTSYGCITSSKLKEEHRESYLDELNDMFSNVDSILTSNSVDHELNRMKQKKDNIYDDYVKSERTSSDVKSSVACLSIVILVSLSFLIIRLFQQKKISKGGLMSLYFIILVALQYYDNAAYEIKNLINFIGNYTQANNYFSQLKMTRRPYLQDFTIQNGDISLNNITLVYREKVVLKNFNVKIRGNDKIAVIGEIGSGKTSILKIIQNLIPYIGNIYIDGQNINKYNPVLLRKYIAYVAQSPRLFNRTIWENLTYGSQYDDITARKIITKFNLDDFFLRFDKGYQTPVGKNGERVSGGQRQIILIVRSILQNKKILLMDEPTSSLDKYHKNLFFDILKKINDKTIIIVTHDNDVLKVTNGILDLSRGKKH